LAPPVVAGGFAVPVVAGGFAVCPCGAAAAISGAVGCTSKLSAATVATIRRRF
jgi:hypothetical protein